jgi:hypothetical protein
MIRSVRYRHEKTMLHFGIRRWIPCSQSHLLHLDLMHVQSLNSSNAILHVYAAIVTSTSTPASMLTMICLTTSVGAFKLFRVSNLPMLL